LLEYTEKKKKKEKKMVNQQGTLLKDTSETIRKKHLNKAINKAFVN
jgi:hypothetical protein